VAIADGADGANKDAEKFFNDQKISGTL